MKFPKGAQLGGAPSERTSLRATVLSRDRQCVAALLDRVHQCRNKWGEPHSPTAIHELTLEHVKDGRGIRFDHPDHCIALCSGGNVNEHWSDANRELAWAYLAGVRAGEGRA